ncbi:MAG: hypothetical protein ISS79_10345 [Phycisphaerae bacterium]|nr:hypothetical protein [Phycisphaerae bacterium]
MDSDSHETRLPAANGWLLEVIRKLAPDPKKVKEYVSEIKKENPALTIDQLADYIGGRIVWTYAVQGGAIALPGAIPGLGTIVQASIEISAVSADIALMVRNQAYLVFALGECYGRKGREVLIQDTLICIGLWTNALVLTKAGAVRLGTKVLGTAFRKKFPAKILQRINKKVGTTILTKYGTKRGGLALGKIIPFGVGVGVGAGFNYIVMKAFKRSCIKYFSLKRR